MANSRPVDLIHTACSVRRSPPPVARCTCCTSGGADEQSHVRNWPCYLRLFVSVSFKIGSAHPGVAVRSYDIRLDCGLAPCQSLTASSTFAMRYERGVHGGELRRQLVIVAESGSEAWRVAGAEARQRTVACVAVQHITSHWTVAGSRNG